MADGARVRDYPLHAHPPQLRLCRDLVAQLHRLALELLEEALAQQEAAHHRLHLDRSRRPLMQHAASRVEVGWILQRIEARLEGAPFLIEPMRETGRARLHCSAAQCSARHRWSVTPLPRQTVCLDLLQSRYATLRRMR